MVLDLCSEMNRPQFYHLADSLALLFNSVRLILFDFNNLFNVINVILPEIQPKMARIKTTENLSDIFLIDFSQYLLPCI